MNIGTPPSGKRNGNRSASTPTVAVCVLGDVLDTQAQDDLLAHGGAVNWVHLSEFMCKQLDAAFNEIVVSNGTFPTENVSPVKPSASPNSISPHPPKISPTSQAPSSRAPHTFDSSHLLKP